ncbi:DNA polymerase IV [Salibacterium halotolerans]|uniref:DNA polymerase IV n=1 Tax=Salibacterium halotolerans TaxID=1884432 RepID=A0A1I5NRC5_9BACI|nr:DNA polymerase IV [Salibacterium halotolerans]SFP24365.1 DNA polymerase-4 [Salibacterium halotolerans]
MEEKTWNGKIVFHVDMNSFYASVEQNHDPSLRGRPLVIAGNPRERRGIVVTASYEARKYGVKTTMPVWEALKKCPDLLLRKPDFDKYRKASAGIFELLEEYTDIVEPVSIDEGYMDVTEAFHKRDVVKLAEEIQNRLQRELGLPASIGVAPCRFLAKMASDMKKPLGITVLRKRDLPRKLWPLPVEEMHGIGNKTAEKMRQMQITTIGELAFSPKESLKDRFGVNGVKLHERANGIDPRHIDPEAASEVKSVGNSTTISYDVTQRRELLDILKGLSSKVEERMRRKQVCSSNIQITIRYKNRRTITRSRKLLNPLWNKEDIYIEAAALLDKYWDHHPVRLLGVTGLDVIPIDQAYKQLDLFTYEQDIQREELHRTMAGLEEKFGSEIISKGFPGQSGK